MWETLRRLILTTPSPPCEAAANIRGSGPCQQIVQNPWEKSRDRLTSGEAAKNLGGLGISRILRILGFPRYILDQSGPINNAGCGACNRKNIAVAVVSREPRTHDFSPAHPRQAEIRYFSC